MKFLREGLQYWLWHCLALVLGYISSKDGLRRHFRLSARQLKAKLGVTGILLSVLLASLGVYILIVSPDWLREYVTFAIGVYVGCILALVYKKSEEK